MISRNLIEQMNTACDSDDGAEVARLFASCPDKEELYNQSGNVNITSLIQFERPNVLREVLRLFPDKLNEPDEEQQTPLMTAIQHYATGCMRVLIELGASTRDNLIPGIRGAAMGMYSGNNDARQHFIALRELGLDAEATKHSGISVFKETLETLEWRQIKRWLDAGAPLYETLKIDVPDPFSPPKWALKTKFRELREGDADPRDVDVDKHNSVGASLLDYVQKTVSDAPTRETTLNPSLFLDETGATRPIVYNWESVSLLPAYFSAKAVPQWTGGIGELLETAHRLPQHMQENLNLPRLKRETKTPCENSVTVAYARNHTPAMDLKA